MLLLFLEVPLIKPLDEVRLAGEDCPHLLGNLMFVLLLHGFRVLLWRGITPQPRAE